MTYLYWLSFDANFLRLFLEPQENNKSPQEIIQGHKLQSLGEQFLEASPFQWHWLHRAKESASLSHQLHKVSGIRRSEYLFHGHCHLP